MSQGPLCPNLTQKVQKEVSQMAKCNFSLVILIGGLSVNLNHLIITYNIIKTYMPSTNVALFVQIGSFLLSLQPP